MRVVRWLGLALALFGTAAAAAERPPATASYTLAPELAAGAITALDVTIHLRASTSGTTRLNLPDKAAGVSELWRNIHDLTVGGAQSVADDGPASRVIRSTPGAGLTVRYRVVSAFDHDPAPSELNTYEPTILPRWFWAYGESLFASSDAIQGPVRFVWKGPPDLPFASDLQGAAGGTMPFDHLLQSVSVGDPDVKITKQTVSGEPVSVAVVGAYDFPGDAFVDAATRIIAGERSFWKTREGPFLVVLAPLSPAPGTKSSRGEGRNGAFAIMTTPNVSILFLKGLIGHEYFHTWNPVRLGDIAADDREPRAYWFSEGFTDFYAWRLLLRMGVFSLEDFAGAWNDMLLAYAGSPVRTEPNERVIKDFWTDHNVEKLPYQRGAILAAIWDERLRGQSKGRTSIDEVMHTMLERAAALGVKSPKAPELFIAMARTFGLDVSGDVARVVDQGQPASLTADAFGTCLRVETLTIPSFDRGFDSEATFRTGVVSGVEPESRAFAAGLRDGMGYVKRESGVPGDSRQPFVLRVKDQGAEQLFSYRPEGKTTITLQQVGVPPDLTPSQRTRCMREAANA